jgi:hypothetical protein
MPVVDCNSPKVFAAKLFSDYDVVCCAGRYSSQSRSLPSHSGHRIALCTVCGLMDKR